MNLRPSGYEAVLRNALHQALDSGAQVAVAKQQTDNDAVATVVDYVLASAPQTVDVLGATRAILTNLAMANLGSQIGIK